jgi:hypothetical protein
MTTNSTKNMKNLLDSFLHKIEIPRRNFIRIVILIVLTSLPIISIVSRNWYSRKISYKYKINGTFSLQKTINKAQWEGDNDKSHFVPFSALISNDGITSTFVASFCIRSSAPADITALYEISAMIKGKRIATDKGIWGCKNELESFDPAGLYTNYQPISHVVTAQLILPNKISVSEIDQVIILIEEEPIS